MAVYFDLNMFTPTSERTRLLDVEVIYQAIAVLLNTRPGTFPFRPEFGIFLEDELFEFADTATALDIFRRLADAIDRFLPRVELDTGRTTIEPLPDENRFDIDIFFTLPDISDQTFSVSGSLGTQGVAA